jgi:hypothetical protein
MNIDQIIRTQGAEELTVSVLSRLEQSKVAYEQQQREDALYLLKETSSDIASLEAISEKLKTYIQMDSDDCQRLSERLLLIIGKIEKAQAELKNLIAKFQAEMADDEARVKADESSIQDRRRAIDNLKSEIDGFNRRIEEAEKWCWVPGYGQYLAIRTVGDLIEGKVEQMGRASEDVTRLVRESQDLQAERATIQANLSNLQQKISNDHAEEAVLEAQKNEFEQQNKLYAERIVFAMNIALYYKQLGESLRGLSDNLDHVMSVLRRLDEIMTYYDIEGKEEKISLKAALLQLGKDTDYYRPTSGADVHRVDYGFSEKLVGSFLQIGHKEWCERGEEEGKIIYSLTETSRDEWSVYLYDNSRKASLQLDLWTNKIYYSDASIPRHEKYQVLSASDRVTGWIAVVVEFGSPGSKLGSFVEVGPREWSELNEEQNKITYHFTETNRDEWSVYLYDNSRKVALQLDLWVNRVYYSDPNTTRIELYTIMAAS